MPTPQHNENREASAIESLRSALWEDKKAENELHYAVVLDPLSWPGLHQRLASESSAYRIYSGSIDREHAAVMPRCARLGPASALTDWLAPRVVSNGGVFFGWGTTCEKDPMASLAVMLARANRVWLPDGRNAWFRWYDPIILCDFLPIADEDQQAFFFGDWIDDIRVFHPLKKEWMRFPRKRKRRTTRPLCIDAEQLERMGEKSFERFIRRLTEMLRPEQPRLTPVMLEDRVRHSVALAEDHGISSENDLIAFVRLDVKSGWALRGDREALALLHVPNACMMEKMEKLESFINKQYKRK